MFSSQSLCLIVTTMKEVRILIDWVGHKEDPVVFTICFHPLYVLSSVLPSFISD